MFELLYLFTCPNSLYHSALFPSNCLCYKPFTPNLLKRAPAHTIYLYIYNHSNHNRVKNKQGKLIRVKGPVAQWVKCRACGSVGSSNPIQGSNCYHEQEHLPSLLSTGWFQENKGFKVSVHLQGFLLVLPAKILSITLH